MTKQEIANKIADLANELWKLERYEIRDEYTDTILMKHTSQTLLSMSDTLDTLAELIESTL